jgi:hypothetical protein
MNRTVQILAWGLAGALLTGTLTGAAVAVAGNGIATPVRPFSLASNRVDQPVHEAPDPHNGPGHDQGAGGSGEARPGDVHIGDGTSGSNSGPGSGSSGSGSDGSGEGSGGSGSDHDGDGGDDDD